MVGEAEKAAVLRVLESGWLTSGPVTEEFTKKFAAIIGDRPAIAVSNATAALFLALRAAGVGPGDEVITSDYTFAATANVIAACGATPVLVDVTLPYLRLDVELVEAAVTSRTKAIMPIHMAGHPDDMDALREIARAKGLFIIEDAAHGIGARYKGMPVGSFGEWAAFSFYANKNMTTGEGGILISTEENLGAARLLANHGIRKTLAGRIDGSNPYYEVVAPGLKFNMPSMSAAVGLAQLDRLSGMQRNRHEVAKRYDAALGASSGLRLPSTAPEVTHGWHLYMVELNPAQVRCGRDRFIEELRVRGIGTSIHFVPISSQPFYRNARLHTRGKSVAKAVAANIFSIPMHGGLSPEEVDRVSDVIGEVLHAHRI
ncbi:DegT/DnrJ/EryC1/StrS family aminotransferase [Nocardia niwae]|uniref:DegT/DnrJ/EryC1/StrS family aminotransferase n=1 Tax=Nocardia niwae TaxID=626084 RepID=UPI001471C566|nr:DegT/DnrJ/EryC1/StrS family aminotransferase [Nocardia niwae]